jgi:hypothetical protein
MARSEKLGPIERIDIPATATAARSRAFVLIRSLHFSTQAKLVPHGGAARRCRHGHDERLVQAFRDNALICIKSGDKDHRAMGQHPFRAGSLDDVPRGGAGADCAIRADVIQLPVWMRGDTA